MKKLVAVFLVPAAVLALGAGGAGAKDATGPGAAYVGPAEGSLPSSGLRGFDDEVAVAVLGEELSRDEAGRSAGPAEGALPSSGLRGYGG